MTTLSTLRTNLRARLDETTPAFWSNTQLDTWINEGARDVSRSTQSLQTTATVAVTAGTQDYSLPSDLVNINRVEYQRTGDNQIYALEPRHQNELDQIWWVSKEITNATPQYFFTWGFPGGTFTIGLYPIPVADGSITIWYYRFPTPATTDGDTVEIPTGWEDLIVDYAEYSALRKDADPRWQEAKALYDSKLESMLATTAQWAEQAGLITTPSGAALPAWLYGAGGYFY